MPPEFNINPEFYTSTNRYLSTRTLALPERQETPKELRKRAKHIEKAQKEQRKLSKEMRQRQKRIERDTKKVRKSLLEVMDRKDGYDRAYAAQVLHQLGMIND